MKKPKIYLYNHKTTGEVVALTKAQGSKLGSEWSRVQSVINEKGERVLRLELAGAVAEISEVQVNGNGKSK